VRELTTKLDKSFIVKLTGSHAGLSSEQVHIHQYQKIQSSKVAWTAVCVERGHGCNGYNNAEYSLSNHCNHGDQH